MKGFVKKPMNPNDGKKNMKITRCGMCGTWLLDGRDTQPSSVTEALEKSGNYELDYCGSCANETSQTKHYVTRDMAIDAGDLSLEGQQIQ